MASEGHQTVRTPRPTRSGRNRHRAGEPAPLPAESQRDGESPRSKSDVRPQAMHVSSEGATPKVEQEERVGWWQRLVDFSPIATAALIVLGVLGLIGVAVGWAAMPSSASLEVLRLLFSPSAVALLAVILGLLIFKEQIGDRIRATSRASAKGPGGLQLDYEAAQSQTLPAAAAVAAVAVEEIPPEVSGVPKANDNNTVKSLEAAVQAAQGTATYWHFQYLSMFLVAQTKQVLRWIDQQGPVIEATYRQTWASFGKDQLDIMLNVLRWNELVVSDGATISITPRGQQFLQFLTQPDVVEQVQRLESIRAAAAQATKPAASPSAKPTNFLANFLDTPK